MTRRLHCPTGDAAEAIYRDILAAHDGEPCEEICDRCAPYSAELILLAADCERMGCTGQRCRFDPPRLHHADPPKMAVKPKGPR